MEDPYCGFKNDVERRKALRNRDIGMTAQSLCRAAAVVAAAVVAVVAGPSAMTFIQRLLAML
jgi:hypothetical protein